MYSTVAQVRKNSPKIDVSALTDLDVTAFITEADAQIVADFVEWISFTSVPELSTDTNFPKVVNILSQYQAAILCLVNLFGAKREAEEVSDIQRFEGIIDGWRQRFREGFVLQLPDGTSLAAGTAEYTQSSRKGIRPALGSDELGEYETEEELLARRGAL